MKARIVILKFVSGLLLAAVTSEATTIYTSLSAFNAATTGTQSIGFEGIAPTGGYAAFNGSTLSGVTFNDSSHILYVVDPAYYPSYYDWGTGATLVGSYNGTVTVSLPTGVKALGSDLMSIAYYGATIAVNLSNGDSFSVGTQNYPNRTFFGVTTSVDISSVTYTVSGGYIEMDNFVFGQAVPDAGVTIAMFGLALAGIAGCRWKFGS
jgi:hypothetical protein